MANGEQASATELPSRPAKRQQICRFYNTKKGCRAGRDCAFLHPNDGPQSNSGRARDEGAGEEGTANGNEASPKSTLAPAPPRAAVARPKPKAETQDPRTFQVNQIQRRFKPSIEDADGETRLTLRMKPSDPDFPYEIDELECILRVPNTYPDAEKPTLLVTNKDIPRGFQINVERGFDTIVSSSPGSTLLGLMNRLDKQLETILAGRIAETVKIVANKDTPKTKPSTQTETQPKTTARKTSPHTSEAQEPPKFQAFSAIQKDEARAKRQQHTRQLEARFNRVPLFSRSSDGRTYTLPLESPRRASWPASLQSVRTFQLLVPELYPLMPAGINLHSESCEARNVEKAFERLPEEINVMSLTQLINHLVLHIPEMAVARDFKTHKSRSPAPKPSQANVTGHADPSHEQPASAADEDRPHLVRIPRPPEWEFPQAEGDEDSSASSSDESDEHSESDMESTSEDKTRNEDVSGTPAERGILLSFPHLELYGIELLEMASLSITVKCERCKDTMDADRLRNYSGVATAMRQATCKKCAATLAMGFRADMIHANSVRAGYLDLDGCTVVDLLPSTFVPTCSECSSQHPTGIVAVRGDSAMTICRECHRKMTMRIAEVKFLLVSASSARASRAPGLKKRKENLGITAGSELPRKGRCSHYSKSFRWFRFSCCSKVFPCDRCHDEQNDHPNEHANRMICGYCSREQNYRPEDCAICHATLIGKKGHGFWEGGKGTRDPKRMSRKDPRKYKRKPGSKTVAK